MRHLERGRRMAGLAAALLSATCLTPLLAPQVAHAQNATWLANPGSGDFNTGGNWTTGTVPTSTATFAASNTTNVNVSFGSILGGLTFSASAPAYTFTSTSADIVLKGAGIINNSSNAPILSLTGPGAVMQTQNSATLGNATINLFGVSGPLSFGGASLFLTDTSSAGTATVTLNPQANVTFANSASGGQARFILDHGSLDFSLLTTGTTIGSFEGTGRIFLGTAPITVGGNDLSTEVSGNIEGTGGLGPPSALIKVGAGTLTLSGHNSYTGTTTVNGGRLTINGRTDSDVIVNPSGNLGGSGTVGGNVVNNGSLAPGNSIGALTVNGSYTQAARSPGPGAGAGHAPG